MLIQGEQADGDVSVVTAVKEDTREPRYKMGGRSTTKSAKTRSNSRSLNVVLCGCLSRRSDCAHYSKKPSPSMNVQLLPSSAVQSMKRLSISCQGDTNSMDDKRHDNTTSSLHSSEESPKALPPSRIHLPSSAIITDALLSRSRSPDSNSGKNSLINGRVVTKQPLWRNFRIKLKKNKNNTSRSVKSNSSSDAETPVNNLLDVAPELSSTDDAEVNEALVFSPLPSQAVPEPTSTIHHNALLGPRSENDKGKKCFVIDLDETLVHSSFKMVEQADFKVGVEIDGITHRVYVLKRPHVDAFLSTMANLYECVLFTASLAKYADPVADFIDKWNTFRYRLFRESCVFHRGNYVKDLSHLGRPINQIVILDNSPASYMFHASHAVQISSWFDDANDRALLDLIPYFERLASHPNVVEFLRTNTPPTPHAAVGTVGLPAASMTSIPLSDVAGRSADSGAIISSIRRPAVASPLPVTLHETRPVQQRREVPTVTTATCTVAEPRKLQPQGYVTNQRLPSGSTLPTTKTTAPISGVAQTRKPTESDSPSSFPAPLCLATYVPVPSQPTAVVISNSTSSNSTQARVGDAANNSHNFPGTAAGVSAVTTRCSTSSTASASRSCYSTAGSDNFSKSMDVRPPEQQKRISHKPPVKPVCSSSGENHHLTADSAPRRLGTIKSLPETPSPLRTSSPPLSVTPSPVSSRRIVR